MGVDQQDLTGNVSIPASSPCTRGGCGRLEPVGTRVASLADLLPPALAAWTANIVFAGLGTALFLNART